MKVINNMYLDIKFIITTTSPGDQWVDLYFDRQFVLIAQYRLAYFTLSDSPH